MLLSHPLQSFDDRRLIRVERDCCDQNKLMMRNRENPHHGVWATRVIWRCAVHTILYDFRTTYKSLSCSHAQKNDDLPATCKPYSCSHAAKKQRLSCHLQTLQLFPRDRKTTIFLPLTNSTTVPTQQKNNQYIRHLYPRELLRPP